MAAAEALALAPAEAAPATLGDAAQPGAHAAKNVAAPPAPQREYFAACEDPADQPVIVIEVVAGRPWVRQRCLHAHSGALLGDGMRRTLGAGPENGLRGT